MAKCGKKCEVWSRVVGYFRPVSSWNVAKVQEFKERKAYGLPPHTEEKSKPITKVA